MSTPTRLPGGELEEAVLHHLWTHGPSTARDVHDAVGAPRELAYTTVARVLDRLVDKQLASRARIGRVNCYTANADQGEVVRSLIASKIGGLFGGDPAPAVAALLGAVEDIDESLLDELARQVDAMRNGNDDGT